LLDRTKQQIVAKQLANQGYAGKSQAADVQKDALNEGRVIKIEQLNNKINQQYLKLQTDSMDLVAVVNENAVAKRQLDAAKLMLDSGVIALIEFERRKVAYQNISSKKIASESKLLQSRQELNQLFLEKKEFIRIIRIRFRKWRESVWHL